MGIRDAFGRRRDGQGRADVPAGSDPPSAAPGTSASGTGQDLVFRRHQADPSTGALMPVPGVPAEATAAAPPTAAPATAAPATAAPATAAPATAAPATAAPATAAPATTARPPGPVLPGTYSRSPRPYDRTVVRHAWELVADRADTLVRTFYAELFVRLGRDAFTMFPAGMAGQREEFGRALVQWVVVDDPNSMSAHLAQLGADHRKFDVEPRHYDIAAEALVAAWRRLLGPQWTPEIEQAVVASYTRLASTMIDGALARGDEPSSWGATVVAHERMSQDFAVLRLRPDSSYPYRPGQYLSVELARRTREWRSMSIASAPRPDNTLDLYVRSVNATGVSASLVMHTGVGDRVRLGAPRGGGLAIDPATLGPGGLLCVCAGTGAAPVAAVVESLVALPQCPPVHVFVGVRTAADVHPAQRIARLVDDAGRADRVTVQPVVTDDPTWTGLRGRIQDVVPPLQDWAGLGVDVLVAGPDSMIATTVFSLVGAGVPNRRIHFDQFDAST